MSHLAASLDRTALRAREKRTNNTYAKLLECVRLDGVREHQAALEQIADDDDGNRADQPSGYQASVDYVLAELASTGWQAQAVPFTYPGTDTVPAQLSPTATDFASGAVTGSGEGDVTG